MTETLSDLLRRSADTPAEPHFDVTELVSQAGARRRRRRAAVLASTAAAVVAITAGSLALGEGRSEKPEPAPPSPDPTPTVVEPQADGTRPLVYAVGATVHVGDRTFDAEGDVGFLDVTDDGVVFVTEDGRMWFHDGTTTLELGRAATGPGDFYFASSYVKTSNPGSLVAWDDATSFTDGNTTQFVVYDTARREVVTTIPVGRFHSIDDGHVYSTPEKTRPGWLLRYDVASGGTTKIRLAELSASRETQARLFVWTVPGTTPEYVDGATFVQVGRDLVHSDDAPESDIEGVLRRTNGEEIRLRVPAGYTQPGGAEGQIRVSQWLDDDHVVLWAFEGAGDLEPQHGDLLVCRLPNGVCRVAVGRSSALYVAPS